MDSMQRFLSKLRELIRGKVKDADLTADEFDECVRQARAHAGGMARWEKMHQAAQSFAEMPAHTGLMVGYWLPEALANGLAQKEGEDAKDLHLTLCYCGDVQILGEVAIAKALVAVDQLAMRTPPLVGTISGVGRFNASNTSDGKDVFYASVDMPQLAQFRQRLAETLGAAGCPARTDHGYTPHITLAYLEPDAAMPTFNVDSVTLRISHITFAAGDKRIDISLTGRDEMYFGESRQFVYDKIADLPDAVKDNLPADAQRVWMAAFNNSIKDGDETKAIRIAWGAIKRAGWKKDGDSWVKASETPPEAILAAVEASEMNVFKLLGEVALVEDGSKVEVQIFPGVGKYSHPRYGELNISKDFLNTVKKNFDARVYQQELPLSIDLEHQSTLSGAAGWIDQLEIRGDKGMWATIPLNDRGKELCSKDAYRYFSPEFYDSWQDPATNKRYNNVLIGGALTNRPFFKGMQAVAMMSEGTFLFVEDGEANQAEEDEISEADNDALGKLDEALAALASFEDDELSQLPPDGLDGLIDAIDLFIGEGQASEGKSFAGGHGGHKGRHSGHGGTMGPIAKKAARKRVMSKLNSDRAGMLGELKTLRTMKLNSPAAEGMRKDMVKAAQADLAKTRAKMVAARAKYRTESGRFAEGDMDIEEMMSKMKSIMDKMEMSDEDKTFMYDVMGKMKKMPGKMKAAAETSGDDASADPVDRRLADKPTGGKSMGMTEEEARQFKELGDSLKTLGERLAAAESKAATEETARKAAESEAKKAAERVAALERTANRKTLSEFVRSYRMSFQGEVEECVDKLEKMQAKLGEDFEGYLDEKRSLHERIKSSPMFEQVSRENAGGNGVAAEFEAAKRKLMAEDSKLTEAEATVRVASENPALYKRYDDAFKTRIKRGGD